MPQTKEILYEVIASIAPEARGDYLDWLKPHVSEMLTFDGFVSGEIFVSAEDECEITSVYRLKDMAAMDAYLAGPAKKMRADGVTRFGGALVARRRILEAL
ncbi:DUF4286 family protein [Hyphococcus sp.]|uniref:DUF4286 family protein n=1 Tax=Hyphococcus sp. TaxID=2038636 RepID=UPI003D0EE1FB